MPVINFYLTDKKERFAPIHYYGTTIPKSLALPKSYSYLVAIDQSTTCTGIYIQDVNDTINFICDFQRMEDVGQYTERLLLFLRKLLKDRQVSLFVYEALPTGAMPNIVLEKLHRQISGWRKTDPMFANFTNRTFDDIPPGIWKSHVYLGPSKDIANAFNTKSQIAAHICEQKPNLLPFLQEIKSKDYDAFDACGIMLGYLREHFMSGTYNPLERRIGGQTKFYDDVYCAVAKLKYINKDLLFEDIAQDLAFLGEESIPFVFWNDKYSFIENIRKALSYEDFVVTLVKDSRVKISLQYRYGLTLGEGEELYIFVGKSKAIKRTDKNFFEKGGRFKCELFK